MKTLRPIRLFALPPQALCALLATAAIAFSGHAQAPATPAPKAPASAPKAINSANLLDRPYNDSWPKPSFPSSPREKQQFTVEYVYRYVQSDYTPAVDITQVKRSEAQLDTPEHTLIALIAALKTLDYDWWLSLWDNKSRQLFEEEARTKKQDAAYWKPIWQSTFVGKPVTLFSRLETVFDITLEFRIGTQIPGRPSTLFPVVLRRENGHWALTRELGDSTFLPWMGRPVFSSNLDFTAVPEYSGQPVLPVAIKSQNLFFQYQAQGQASATDLVW